jgi:hypothetical protein
MAPVLPIVLVFLLFVRHRTPWQSELGIAMQCDEDTRVRISESKRPV